MTQSNQNTSNQLVSSIVISHYLAESMLANCTHSNVKVHSVFPNGFNLELKGQLIFVGKHGGDLSAFGLTLEKSVFEQLGAHLQGGQRVKITPELWTFYTRPTLLQLVPSKLNKVVLDIPKVTREDLRNSQLLTIIEEVRALENSGFVQSENLMAALKQWPHVDEIPEQLIRILVGAGIGLTPSGDDFLQGVLLIESALGEHERLRRQVETVLKDRTTTVVSHAYYSALFAGKVNLSWVKLLRAVKEQASVATITALVQDIQHYGATSGNDILVGIATSLKTI